MNQDSILFENVDFDKICRTCLSSAGELTSVLNKNFVDNRNVTITEMIFACTSLQVSYLCYVGM